MIFDSYFHRICLFAAALMISGPACAQENWTRFRGPNGTGIVESETLPTTHWKENLLWEVKLAGTGSSSPVIWGDHLFVTSCNQETAELAVECFDSSSGKPKWRKSFASTPHQVHQWNSYAASSPVVDETQVYFTYANLEHTFLISLDHEGNEVWKRDFGPWVSAHGFSMSPMIHDGKVIFNSSQQAERLRPNQKPGQSELIAVDCKTGKDVWRTKLATNQACYSVPCVHTIEGVTRLIGCSTGEGFYSVDPENGRVISSAKVFRMRTVASPIVFENLLYGSNGSGGGGNYLVAGSFEGSEFKKAFEVNRNANYVSTPIVVNRMLFLFGDKGIASCFDAVTGELHWRERLSEGFSGSPVANSENIYLMDSEGKVLVIAASPEFNLVSSIELHEPTRASPAVAGNRIFFRTNSQLFAFGIANNSASDR